MYSWLPLKAFRKKRISTVAVLDRHLKHLKKIKKDYVYCGMPVITTKSIPKKMQNTFTPKLN